MNVYSENSGIYAIRNTVTNKILIGRTTNLIARHREFLWQQKNDLNFGGGYMRDDIKYYGKDKFVFEVVDISTTTINKNTDEYKEKWINKINKNMLYNYRITYLEKLKTEMTIPHFYFNENIYCR